MIELLDCAVAVRVPRVLGVTEEEVVSVAVAPTDRVAAPPPAPAGESVARGVLELLMVPLPVTDTVPLAVAAAELVARPEALARGLADPVAWGESEAAALSEGWPVTEREGV